jgi:hypothetical protein
LEILSSSRTQEEQIRELRDQLGPAMRENSERIRGVRRSNLAATTSGA